MVRGEEETGEEEVKKGVLPGGETVTSNGTNSRGGRALFRKKKGDTGEVLSRSWKKRVKANPEGLVKVEMKHLGEVKFR